MVSQDDKYTELSLFGIHVQSKHHHLLYNYTKVHFIWNPG